jgi:hypothetical protein
MLCLHQSSGHGFHRRTFPFLWVPKLSPCLSQSNSTTRTFSRMLIIDWICLLHSRRLSLYSWTLTNAKVKLWYYRRSVGLSIFVSSIHLGPKTRFLLPLDSFGFVVVCPAEQIIYCFRLEPLPPLQIWKARYQYLYTPGTGWPSYTPRYCVPFPSSPTTHKAAMEVFEPSSVQ